jgi:GH15 family glucan-1,4-alpha-glucosidase
MSKPIEDYALIGDRRSAALVARDGCIDWLCWPRALLGDERHGSWRLAPSDTPLRTTRRYRPDTLILETRHTTAHGVVVVTDFMAVGAGQRAIIRRVSAEEGKVEMELLLKLRFDYGRRVPWQRAGGRGAILIVGPDLVTLRSDIELAEGQDCIVVRFAVAAGQTVTFALQHGASYEREPASLDGTATLAATEQYWRGWVSRFDKPTEWTEAVKRSLLTVQALVDAESGGIVAAPTLGLPEVPAGNANWDYCYTWLRDSTFTLSALVHAGFADEAQSWRDWLLRAVAGDPDQIRTMYRLDGAIHIEPRELP